MERGEREARRRQGIGKKGKGKKGEREGKGAEMAKKSGKKGKEEGKGERKEKDRKWKTEEEKEGRTGRLQHSAPPRSPPRCRARPVGRDRGGRRRLRGAGQEELR